MAATWWDVPYTPDGSDPEHTRFLRLHAAPLSLPEGGAHATAVVIHGGYWKNKFGLDDPYGNAGTATLAPFFLSRGFSVVELEYRRRDHEGGGWPGTNDDIVLALRKLHELHVGQAPAGAEAAARALQPNRLLLLGHSAGGALALWAAHALSAAEAPSPQVLAVVALAPVADLARGHEMKISDEGDAVELYMKCTPAEAPEAYARASPSALLPVKFPLLVVFGSEDKDVPPDLVRGYADAALKASPDLVSVLEVPGSDHFDIVNGGSSAWLEQIAPALSKVPALEEAAASALLSK